MWAQGLLGLAGFLIFGMRYYYVALTDCRLNLPERLLLDLAPQGVAWANPRDSITISDLQTDNKLWNWGKISSPTKQNLRMNFHAFWRPELKAMGDMLADRIVGPHLGPERPAIQFREVAGQAPSALTPPPAPVAASAADGGLNGPRGTLCYPGAVPGV